jgi:hypothetical protein
MVEMRFGEKWPRDGIDSMNTSPEAAGNVDWRIKLEVGDRVDVSDVS